MKLFACGYVAKAHGLAGGITVRLFDPLSTALFEVDEIVLKGKDGKEKTYSVDDARGASKGNVTLLLDGVTKLEAAEALIGSTVQVRRDDLEPPADGELFLGDLIGLEAFSPEGKSLGIVEEIIDHGAAPNLVIRSKTEEVIVPFAEDFVSDVDVAKGRLTVVPPEFV